MTGCIKMQLIGFDLVFSQGNFNNLDVVFIGSHLSFFFLRWVMTVSTQTLPNSVTGPRRIVQECLMVSITG